MYKCRIYSIILPNTTLVCVCVYVGGGGVLLCCFVHCSSAINTSKTQDVVKLKLVMKNGACDVM